MTLREFFLKKQFLCILCAIGFFASALTAIAESRPDQDTELDIAAHSSSSICNRPADAEYFWWDIEPPIDVELVFVDGTKSTVGSDKEFSKRIVSVKFINNSSAVAHVTLHARF